jgi:chorismate mutase/prephenate dehydratase
MLEHWRRQIDQIDEELLKLLNARMELALQIGRAKRAQRIPVYDKDREAQIIERLCAANRGPLDALAVQRIFSQIFAESRRLQEGFW